MQKLEKKNFFLFLSVVVKKIFNHETKKKNEQKKQQRKERKEKKIYFLQLFLEIYDVCLDISSARCKSRSSLEPPSPGNMRGPPPPPPIPSSS